MNTCGKQFDHYSAVVKSPVDQRVIVPIMMGDDHTTSYMLSHSSKIKVFVHKVMTFFFIGKYYVNWQACTSNSQLVRCQLTTCSLATTKFQASWFCWWVTDSEDSSANRQTGRCDSRTQIMSLMRRSQWQPADHKMEIFTTLEKKNRRQGGEIHLVKPSEDR